MKPNFEPFAHTARDLVERDITLYETPTSQNRRQGMFKSSKEDYRKIGETLFITESYEQYNNMTKNELLSHGTHAMMRPYMMKYELTWATEYDHDQGKYKYNKGRGFYRGEKVSGLLSGGGYLTNKKWHLNEVENEEKMSSLSLKPFTIWGCT